MNSVSIFDFDNYYGIIVSMSGKRVFLERKFKDCRFRKAEDAILDTYVKEHGKDLTVVKMAKKAGLGRATMYVHHHATREIVPDYQRYILFQFRKETQKKLRRKNSQLKSLYLDLLIFILRNKKIFEMFLKFDNREALVKILTKLKPKVVSSMRFPKNSDRIFRIYASEVAELIMEWGEKGFSEKEMGQVLSDIMYLTESARSRLLPLEH